jgi:hypothetical protein
VQRLLAVSVVCLFPAVLSASFISIAEFEVDAKASVSVIEPEGVVFTATPSVPNPVIITLGAVQFEQIREPGISGGPSSWLLDAGHYTGAVSYGVWNEMWIISRARLFLTLTNTTSSSLTVPVQFTYETQSHSSFNPNTNARAYAEAGLNVDGQRFTGSGEGVVNLLVEPNSTYNTLVESYVRGVAVIPEPGTGMLVAGGLFLVHVLRRKRGR